MEQRLGQMELDMREITKKERSTGKENLTLQMVVFITENFQTTKSVGEESIDGMMAKFMKGNG